MNTKRVKTIVSVAVCIIATTMSIAGCGGSAEATKLEAPDGVDWEAIEAEGAQMNEEQSIGE